MKKYAIIDIETTGGSPQRDKITEIAILIHDGNKIIDEFVTLINPERFIPHFITSLTGVTNEIVADAPKFYEVAKEIVKITEGKIFVAHNANFDYHFIRNEFKNLGFKYKRDVLCTVKLSRKLIPGLQSYSLGKLCDELQIKTDNRHRAAGDAIATSKIFDILLSLDRNYQGKESLFHKPGLSNLNPDLDTDIIKDLPEETGIYYFYNKDKNIIYIGKSKNIHQRVITHLSNNSSKRAVEMKDRITCIGYEITGNELIALLLESDEIKKHKPVYNRAQRRTSSNHSIYTFKDENGYIRFSIEKNKDDTMPLASYESKEKARKQINKIIEDFNLCQKLSGLYDSPGNCFQHQIGICHGACIQIESSEEYNQRAAKAQRTFEFEYQNLLIIDQGRKNEERAVVKIENGRYIGFGYIDISEINTGYELFHDCIKPYQDNRDVQHIIKRYLKRNKPEKIITF